MRLLQAASALILSALPIAAHAQWSASRPDSHAPIGVMGDHRHEAGEVMLSFRYMPMMMRGSRIGTTPIGNTEIVSPTGAGFTVTPIKMPMQMYMLGAMYAPSHRVTLMAMGSYHHRTMDHITRAGGQFTTTSDGIGDVSVGGLIGLADWGRQSLFANVGLSVPVGSITAMDVLPTSAGQPVQLPYPMQIGSGTWDVLPGLTYLGQVDNWSWGGQTRGTFRLGHNSRDWRLGHRGMLTFWGARQLGRHASLSIRMAGETWGDVRGADAAASVNPAVVPTARTDLRGGTQLDAGLGLNLYVPKAQAFRVAAELLLPVYRDLHGPQLETDWTVVVGLQIVPVR